MRVETVSQEEGHCREVFMQHMSNRRMRLLRPISVSNLVSRVHE